MKSENEKLESSVTVPEILMSLDDGFDKLVISEMIQEKIKKEKESSYDQGFQKGKQEEKQYRDKYDGFFEGIFNLIYVAIAIVVVVGVWMFFNNVSLKQEALEKSEMSACVAGKYQDCKEGWLRTWGEGSARREQRDRAKAYEEAYYFSTKSYLIENPRTRLLDSK